MAATVGGVATSEMAVEVAVIVKGVVTYNFIGHLSELRKVGKRFGRCEYHAYISR